MLSLGCCPVCCPCYRPLLHRSLFGEFNTSRNGAATLNIPFFSSQLQQTFGFLIGWQMRSSQNLGNRGVQLLQEFNEAKIGAIVFVGLYIVLTSIDIVYAVSTVWVRCLGSIITLFLVTLDFYVVIGLPVYKW